MIGSIANIAKIPELKRRVLFTLLLLLVYRLGVHVPTPGINTLALKEFFGRYQQTLFGVIDMFTGGALETSRYSHWALCHILARLLFCSSLRLSFHIWNGCQKRGKLEERKLPNTLVMEL